VDCNRFQSIEMHEWESIIRMKGALMKIKDVHGNDIYTDGQMFSYLQQFEMSFHDSKARIIDSTEGGAAKRYTTAMPLADALAKYAVNDLPPSPAEPPADTPDVTDDKGRAEIMVQLSKRIDRAREMRAFYDRTLSILKDIKALWPDQEAIGPLLAEIDGIRREIETYSDINSLVRDVAQATELAKIQHDRAILSKRLDGLEQQKAQLERDLEYVGGLRSAVDELEKLLADGLERFRTFDFEGRIFAVGRGRDRS
jgi:hypothetical protein